MIQDESFNHSLQEIFNPVPHELFRINSICRWIFWYQQQLEECPDQGCKHMENGISGIHVLDK
jgi:hypothetical protein